MSDKTMARRTTAQVSFGGVDITEDIRRFFLSMTYTDNEEDEADDLQIKLQDREGLWGQKWLSDIVNAAASPATAESDDSEANGDSYEVTAIALHVRAQPSMKAATYGYLAQGDVIQVSTINGAWATTTYQGKTAYVGAKYIKKVGSSSGNTSTAAAKAYTVTAKGLNVRSGPGTKHSILGVLKKDDVVQVSSISGSWATIDYNGKTAYVHKSYIKEGGTTAEVKAANTAANTNLKIQAVIVRQNWKGDGKDDLLECGTFELDSVDVSGPPATVTIRATALPYTAQIRQTLQTKAWESYYLSGIIREMSEKNGMSYLFLSEYDPYYERKEQYKVSDIKFLEGLCHDAGISLKVTNQMIVAFDQAAYEAKDSVLTIKRADGGKDPPDYIKYKLDVDTADSQYQSCRVQYTDPDTGQCITGMAYVEDYKEDAKDNQQLEITEKVSTTAEANTLAKMRLRMHNKYAKTVSFTMIGNPKLLSGMTFELKGWGAWDRKYIITKATHSLGSGGYTTKIEGRAVLEGY